MHKLTRRQGIKKSEAARKQRELKKYGKQIQVEKLKQREQDKKGFADKIQGLKRSEHLLHPEKGLELTVQRERREWSWARRAETTSLELPSTTGTTDLREAEGEGEAELETVASPR